MPELPEVETVMRGMAAALEGRIIARAEQRVPALRIPFPDHLAEKLAGRTIERFRRRAKYALMYLDDGQVFILHLGMAGRVHLIESGAAYHVQKHDHLVIHCRDGCGFALNDSRRFGMVMLMPEKELESHKAFAGLGPEPLDNMFSGPVLHEALTGKKTPVKNMLLDQSVVAGLGNIYACEALYFSGIHPARPAGALTADETERLAAAIKDVLRRAIAAGGSSLRDYRQADGALGYFQHQFAVYGKAGKACPDCVCDVVKTGGIQKIRQSGRSTFFCPQKQK